MSSLELVQTWSRYLLTNPVMILVLVILPLLILARWKQIYPNRLLVYLLLVPVALSLGLLFKLQIVPLLLGADLLIIATAVFDIFSLPSSRDIEVERLCQPTASLRKKHPVSLIVSNTSKRLRRLLMRDGLPQELAATPDEFNINLPARSRVTVSYNIRASRRGAFDVEDVFVRASSKLGIWKRILKLPCSSKINVYPDMKQLAEFEVLARTNRLSLMGVRRTRRVGQDNDFERLRDYTLDDNYKHIDWRSTARRQKLTVRDFQTSQSQRLIFMIDCGRMMTNQAAGLSLLDHAFNAMLMLSYIALRRGDAVGLICFSDRIHSFVPPRGGSRQMNHLLRASFDRFPDLVESRYEEAFLHLSQHCRKRSLVVLITNLIDEINANQIHQYLSTLVGRHLPMGVLLRDHELFSAADTPWTNDAGLFRAAAAADILCWRHEILTDLQHQGVLALDVFPEALTAPLINQYLEVKARHLL